MKSYTAERCLITVFFAFVIALVPSGSLMASRGSAPSALTHPAAQEAGWSVIQAADEQLEWSPSGDQTLSIAGPVQMTSLDPAFVKDLATMFLLRQIYSGLTRLDENLEPVPALAERIEVSSDGLIYRFVLRDNARFQDGQPITAADVEFSFTRAMNPATANGMTSLLAGPTFLADIAGAAALLAGEVDELEGIDVIDERTVEILLEEPRSTFLMKLAAGPALIVNRTDVAKGDGWWEDPAASGPFVIRSFEENQLLVLERNEIYYLEPPALRQVNVRLGTNAFQPLNLYEAGEIDIAGVGSSSAERVTDPASNLFDQVTVTSLFAIEYLALRTDVAPLDDPMIRRALLLGFPRHRVATVSFNGHAIPASGFVPDGMLGIEEWSVVGADYDLEAARQAIRESSYGSAEAVPPIVIYGSGVSLAESVRDVIQEDLGLRIEVVSVNWPEYIEGLGRRIFPAYSLYWGADYPDPETFLLTLFGSESADNYVDYRNSEFDELLRQAAAEQDPTARAAIHQQANQVLMDDAVVLPMYYDIAYTLTKPWVKGLDITPLGILYLDRVWLER
jgi:oligopeptide transport system substrate-binding protein